MSTEEKFLDLLDKSMLENPELVKPISKDLWNKIKELTEGVNADIDAPLTDE